LPHKLVGARLVQRSDLHIGPAVDDSYLLHAFRKVQEIEPEIVVYTGDFTSYAADVFAHSRRMFVRLPRGRLATLGILGNHDYGPNWEHPDVADGLSAMAASAGVQVLRNEVADVSGLQVVGLDDLWAERFDNARALARLERARASLVLSHNPDTADLAGWGNWSGWILAGHTHGGQCKPPFLDPPLIPVQNRRYTAGEFDLPGGRRMYINRGLGHLLQVRFNVRPEVTLFRLCRA
jgi:predicted MPP superfamily phosphohydrolase